MADHLRPEWAITMGRNTQKLAEGACQVFQKKTEHLLRDREALENARPGEIARFLEVPVKAAGADVGSQVKVAEFNRQQLALELELLLEMKRRGLIGERTSQVVPVDEVEES